MSEQHKPTEFASFFDGKEPKGRLDPADRSVIVGGTWTEAQLATQLQHYEGKPDLPWRIWDYTDSCSIGQDWMEQELRWLERARLFGEGGDLDVRRDGKDFLWRYVGEPEHAPPDQANTEMKTFARLGTDVSPIYGRERTALLWGTQERDQAQWFDDRTSGADLSYQVEEAPERVQVRYVEYTRAGRTIAVWLRGLEAYDG